jgi:RND family efflux transporter MFP subunit
MTHMKVVAAIAALALVSCTNGDAGGPPVLGGGAAAASGGRGEGGGGGGRSAPTIVLAATDVYTVSRGTIETTTPLSGDLRPTEEIFVRARVEGDLMAVLVREGEAVRAGDVLARFDTTELSAALMSAEAEVAAARGEASTADWNLEQSRELLRAGAISEQSFRAAEQTALAAKARLAAAASRLRSAEIARRDAHAVAPASGTISQRFVQSGERVARGAQLFVIVRDDTLEFTAAVPARAASIVRVGQEVRFTVDDRAFTGRVARVSPAIDPASRSVSVYVRVPNRDRQLKANAFASGRVVSSEQHNVLIIPLAAVRRSQQNDSEFVYRLDGSSVIDVRPIRIGGTDEAKGIAQVLDGLAESDRIIVGNVGTIGRGMRAQILDADSQTGRR